MDAGTVVGAVMFALPALPALLAVVLLGGAVVGWRTRRANWAIRLVFPRRYTHPGLSVRRRVRRAAVAGAGTLAVSATTLLVPMHWAPFVVTFTSLPMMLVRVGMMKADAAGSGGPEPLPPGAPRTSSDPVQLQTPNWHGPGARTPPGARGTRTGSSGPA